MELSVIISSSNHDSNCLNKALTGFAMQRFKDFEILIAGIQPSKSTLELIASFKQRFRAIKYIEQPPVKNKSALLNMAIQASQADYLIFTEANCIPRQDFLQIHQERKEETFFLSGGAFKLAPQIHQEVEQQHIEAQTCFETRWLKSHGLRFSLKNQQLSKNKLKSNILNALIPGKALWNPHNVSCWKKDLMDINGFDEQIDDADLAARDLYQRLRNNDIKGIRVGFNAICLHLNKNTKDAQNAVAVALQPAAIKPLRSARQPWTQYGIYKGRTLPVPYTEIDKG
ncbi:glycosyltransferase [Arachidicoccus ginsenosidivorans]|uniref:Glycosyltransferase n=1 Tax=Arachidicoccus ginsenosidivorans TaxID=496057 RepID=A0A5B8VHJ0_9BACT|nr:glycosyltransferase [Arachidicoccus ginsenosidivorans]QEC71004.1 glycosyltransferase [Arachidicoccus ginsenosidivorans]